MHNLLPFADEFNTLVCRAKRGTQANLGLMAYRTYMKTAIVDCQSYFVVSPPLTSKYVLTKY
jgi:hypothetical protein